MTPCARHHLAWGQHAPGCTCTPDCPDHEGHCTGCLPVEASNGLLCSTDSRRLRGFLGSEEGLDPEHPVHGLPWAYDYLEHAYPSLSQAPGGTGGRSGVSDPEAERLAALVTLRAEMHDRIASWTEMLADDIGSTGPDFTRGRFGQRLRTVRRAAWLLIHVEALEAHEAVADAWSELADLMSRAHALAPWRPPQTHIDGVPCRCGHTSLHDHSDEIKCWHCGYAMDREQYRVLTTVYARRFAGDPRGQRALATPVLPRVSESASVADIRRAVREIEDEMDRMKTEGVTSAGALAHWETLRVEHERLQAALDPAVHGYGGRP